MKPVEPGARVAAPVFREEQAAAEIWVYVYGADPCAQAAVASHLAPEVRVVEDGDVDRASVALLVSEVVDPRTATVAQALQRDGCPRVVLVATHLDEAAVLAGIEAGACGFLRRSEATKERLIEVARTAHAGHATVPEDLLGPVLDQLRGVTSRRSSPRGSRRGELAEREVEVIRLVAEGLDTSEIAVRLHYSERTVKGIIHDVTRRLGLRNRSHAVAFAIRRGLI